MNNTMKKKIITIILLGLFLFLSNGCLRKVNTESDEYFIYKILEDNTYSIRAKDINKLPEKLELPKFFKDKLITEIAGEAFKGSNIIRSVTIPNTYRVIGNEAFVKCKKLTKLYLPNTIGVIGKAPFAESAIREIYYEGTKAEWDNIIKANNWNLIKQNILMHFSDFSGEISGIRN